MIKIWKILVMCFPVLICLCLISQVSGTEIEIPSSFNPVGSGARAIGMGGAFIAVADDATAASWNPGGLIQLRLPEFSVVGSGLYRQEEIEFGTNPEADGSHSVSEANINYLSAAYPFNLFDRNMVVALSYQHLYDFNREWEFTLKDDIPPKISDDNWEYQQRGSLSAIGLSYCIQVIPQLSIGFTLNLWEDSLSDNEWEQKYRKTGIGKFGSESFVEKGNKIESYSFSGFNANIGILWRINYKLTLGAVLKTPFTANLEHRIQKRTVIEPLQFNSTIPEDYTTDDQIDMPMSYGIGIAYKFSDMFFMSADVYRTEWDNFIYRNSKGKETSPISGRNMNESDISPTHQVRIGFEYRFTNPKKGYIIPIRSGIFYDPAPAEGSPDDFYGFSIGSGITLNDRFSLDIAYQYRYGNNVGKSILEHLNFSQDVNEHMVYISVIFYKF